MTVSPSCSTASEALDRIERVVAGVDEVAGERDQVRVGAARHLDDLVHLRGPRDVVEIGHLQDAQLPHQLGGCERRLHQPRVAHLPIGAEPDASGQQEHHNNSQPEPTPTTPSRNPQRTPCATGSGRLPPIQFLSHRFTSTR